LKISSLGQPIPGTTNVYAWGGGQVLKLYDHDAPSDGVDYVGRVDRALHEAGLSVPAVGELIEIEGRLGQVYERIEGDSLAAALFGAAEAPPERIIEPARVFADVQADIHAHGPISELPSQQHLESTVIRRVSGLPTDLEEATLSALAAMPTLDRLCHGDYHPYNVLLSQRGPVVIDWNNAHIGDPLGGVARSALILSGVALMQPPLADMVCEFRRAYLDRYFELRPGDRAQLGAWKPIVAAARLADGIPELEPWLLEQIRVGLGG
jgi:aminoglycoside phosphotransferase (APT) family kinase protein